MNTISRSMCSFHVDGGYEALKQAVAELLAQNEEKNVKIEELRKAVETYQKVEEIILGSARGGKSGDTSAVHTLETRKAVSPHPGSVSVVSPHTCSVLVLYHHIHVVYQYCITTYI